MASITIGLPEKESFERTVVRLLPDGRLTRADAAAYLGIQPKTLAKWSMEGRGPRVIRVGSRCFYARDELDRFIGKGSERSGS